MKNKFITFLSLILVLATFVSCNEQTNNANLHDFVYQVDGNKVSIIKHKNADIKEITVPEEIEGRKVVEIKKDAFYQHKNLEKIVLPNNLEEITGAPFYRCYSLKNVTIPKNVATISGNPFFRCVLLENIFIDENNKNFVSKNGVLYNKDLTVLYAYPEGKTDKEFIVPNTVTRFYSDCFGYKPKFKKLL